MHRGIIIKILLGSILAFVHTTIEGQELNWMNKTGGVEVDYGTALKVDTDQSMVEAIVFNGTANTTNNQSYTSRGADDVLIRKSNRLGITQWIVQIASKKQDIVHSIDIDKNKFVYVTGVFSDSLFANSNFVIKAPSNISTGFVLKFTQSGILIWAKIFESTIGSEARSIAVQDDNQIIVVGSFIGSTNFESGQNPITFSSNGASDIFVVNINSSTSVTSWVKTIGDFDNEFAYDVAVDTSDNIIIVGEFKQIVDFDPSIQRVLRNSRGLNDGYILKLDKFGAFLWVQTFGGSSFDVAASVAIDNRQNVICGGRFSDGIAVNQTLSLLSKGGTDGLVLKLNAIGQVLWAQGYGAAQNDQVNVVQTNSTGVIFAGGVYRGKVDFNLDPMITDDLISNGGSDFFILTLNQDGSYSDNLGFGGAANDQINDISIQNNINIICTGGFGAVVDFDPSSSDFTIFSTGNLDAFLLSLHECIAPYIVKASVDIDQICFGERILLRVNEGYLNGATAWSWHRDSCSALAFGTGEFISQKPDKDITYWVKGQGGCITYTDCIPVKVDVFTDTLIYRYLDLCQGDTLRVGNSNYTNRGVFVDSLQSVSGCDSTLITEINILPSFFKVIEHTICAGDTVRVGKSIYTSSGNFTDVFQTSNGCDSTIISKITLLPSIIRTTQATICEGDAIKIEKETYRTAGTFIQSSQSPNGCEDLLIVKISVVPTKFYQIKNLCDGDIFTVGGSSYNKTGDYIDTLLSSVGCDSIIYSSLIFLQKTTTDVSYTLCEGESIKIGTSIYTTSGRYTDILVRSNGCDSIVFSNIRVVKIPIPTTRTYQICEGEFIFVGSKRYGTTGTYIDTLSNSNGCDSILTTKITVKLANYTKSASICQGDTAYISTLPYTNTGVYQESFTTKLGCDSTVTLTLVVNSHKKSQFNIVLCPGDTIISQGYKIFSERTIIDTLISKSGCDSIRTISSRFNYATSTISRTFCTGDSIVINNKVYKQSGSYTDTITRVNDCDSILQINLTVNPHYVIEKSFEICNGESVTIGASTYFNSGKYTEYLTTKKGCDSIINFEIKVIIFIPTFSIVNDSLTTFIVPGASYQWLECINGQPIPIFGAVAPKLKISKNGHYALEVTYKGCKAISSCQSITITATEDSSTLSTVSLYPNPTSSIISLVYDRSAHVKIYDTSGRIIKVYDHQAPMTTFDLSEFHSGVYIISIINDQAVQNRLITKQ